MQNLTNMVTKENTMSKIIIDVVVTAEFEISDIGDFKSVADTLEQIEQDMQQYGKAKVNFSTRNGYTLADR
jgi:mannose-1-phosphate guanylyltransferase